MPQSLANILVHIVFSTKDRAPFIDESIRDELHAYLATVIRNSKSECFRVDGTEDHVHMAIRLHRTQSISKLIEEVKSVSSGWIKKKSPDLISFSWQRGYGAFSLGLPELGIVIDYISGQVEHHKTQSFQEEFRALCIDNGIVFDERYVWD
jgi:REP element-mobilizing transposase RayT